MRSSDTVIQLPCRRPDGIRHLTARVAPGNRRRAAAACLAAEVCLLLAVTDLATLRQHSIQLTFVHTYPPCGLWLPVLHGCMGGFGTLHRHRRRFTNSNSNTTRDVDHTWSISSRHAPTLLRVSEPAEAEPGAGQRLRSLGGWGTAVVLRRCRHGSRCRQAAPAP
jgi:hypothetical protein